ncbi:MAG TPA: hypothetical protein VGI83_04195 [Gemmatimonadales bacterium]|jgi:hypothetical protein
MLPAMRSLGVLLFVAAQTPAPTLPGCPTDRVVGDIGVNGLDCIDCEIHGAPRRGASWIQFKTEPGVKDVRGPAVGRLQPGDIIVSIDSLPIASARGSQRYSRVMPGQTIRFAIRRGTGVTEVTVVAGAMCGGPPSRHVQRI